FAEQPLPGMAAKRPSRIAVRARLEAAVRRALHTSRAALLGASLDSAALVALMTRLSGRVRTFSVAFGDGADLGRGRGVAHLLRLVAPRRHRGRLQRAGLALQSRGASRARAFVELFSADERRALLGSAARVAAHGPAEELAGVDSALAFDLMTGLPDSVLF